MKAQIMYRDLDGSLNETKSRIGKSTPVLVLPMPSDTTARNVKRFANLPAAKRTDTLLRILENQMALSDSFENDAAELLKLFGFST